MLLQLLDFNVWAYLKEQEIYHRMKLGVSSITIDVGVPFFQGVHNKKGHQPVEK